MQARAAAGLWKAHLGATAPEVVLLHGAAGRPFDMQMLARVLDEGARRGASGRMSWRWQGFDGGVAAQPGEIWVLGDDPARELDPASALRLAETPDASVFVGPAAAWFAGTPHARGQRVAIHWEDAGSSERLADDVVASPSIIEVAGRHASCSGGFAVVDLALLMLHELADSGVALQVMDALCLDRLREPGSRQRSAAAGVLGAAVPKLAEAIALMEANVEEWLQTDEIARLVGVSRRQLERLFKQHLGTVPSRYYLDIRLRRARKLLRETRHSLVQVGLMCGFSSASHFSTTYGCVFGVTPREERQRVMSSR